jgi:hypothetical protein
MSGMIARPGIGALAELENWGLGTIQSQVGTCEIPAGKPLRECSIPDWL